MRRAYTDAALQRLNFYSSFTHSSFFIFFFLFSFFLASLEKLRY